MHSATLPIDAADGLRMEPKEARALGSLLAEDYKSADPFPHIVIDGILPEPLIRQIFDHFPREKLKDDVVFDIGYGGHHKRQVMPEQCDAFVREFFHFMNSQPMLQFLEGLTGIDALLPDPYFNGGGFHETTRGGKLGVHADFRIHEQLNVQRRINLLIYLNETWDDGWRGQLELWDKSMTECRVRVSPLWNRCVVFSTDADTWHGHPDELLTPDGVKRRSVALYYYTASKNVYNEVPNLSTMYQARPTDSAAIKKETREFKTEQYLRDWMPPVLLRGFYKARRGVAKVARGIRGS
jgi:2OG-Fe(II) oxygenase superfamily